jgi:hypothetical protein
MTAIVGVLCRDGVVIGTDSSTTFMAGAGFRTIEQRTEKLKICADAVIVAGTGQVGLGQRFCQIVEQAHVQQVFGPTNHFTAIGKELSRRAIQDFASTGVQGGQYASLIGFALDDTPHLCEFAVSDFQPEFKTETLWYCSMGSGQMITDPFLAFMREVFWADGRPTVQDATFAVTWTLDHAVQVNPGGINGPVKVAVLERRSGSYEAYMLEDAYLDEHRQNIDQAKDRLRAFRASQSADAPGTPEVPRPEETV